MRPAGDSSSDVGDVLLLALNATKSGRLRILFFNFGVTFPSCPKTRTEPKAGILEAFSKLAEASRRGTGSAIGEPEQSSPLWCKNSAGHLPQP